MPVFRFSSTSRIAAAILVSLQATAPAKPPVIDDRLIASGLYKALSKAADEGGIPTADELGAKANETDYIKPQIDLPEPPQPPNKVTYEDLSRSVYLISAVYKCGKCHKWHQGSSATAWCLGPDGLMVTNAHVFKNTKGGAIGVSDRKGNFYPVTELLGMDAATDLAVFRVKASNLQALALGAAAEVGAPVTAITNPSGNLFYQSSGSVARYSIGPGKAKNSRAVWMSITADYAKGSSGGPILNDAGEVVGMVSSTVSVYTEPSTGDNSQPPGKLQMVIKQCVPADAIRALFAPEAPAQSTKAD